MKWRVPPPPCPISHLPRQETKNVSPASPSHPQDSTSAPAPAPHLFHDFITPDDQLFQKIHTGRAVVDKDRWRLVVTGLVKRPFSVSLEPLLQFARTSATSFHELLRLARQAAGGQRVARVGNARWTGVRLRDLLALAQAHPPQPTSFCSEGLDSGAFAGVGGGPLSEGPSDVGKATSPEVLLAWRMDGEDLSRERGGPARLLVPGWFGTNSTEWLCKLEVSERRAEGPFTTVWYNELDPVKSDGTRRPVWEVEPNSIIVRPVPGEVVSGGRVLVQGWAWSGQEVQSVEVSFDGSEDWTQTDVSKRRHFEWQRWALGLHLKDGEYQIMARATSKSGAQQPLSGRRNHVHRVKFTLRNENEGVISGG